MKAVVMRVTAGRVEELIAAGAQLVEVLPRPEFEEQHLTGAVNIPLKELDAEAVAGLDRGTPVIVYCWDSI
jgi:rhodanese-related sulfurtransferase